MALKLTNNASSTLQSAISDTDTSLSVATGDGDLFPVLSTGDYFELTLVDTSGALEIVRATARTGDALTVTRAQAGTTAIPFAAGARVELRVTVGNLDAIGDGYLEL